MIAHVSIPSRNPRPTALFIAGLIDGEAFDFPVVPGAWIAIASDGSGKAVEVCPDPMAHHMGQGEVDPNARPQGPQPMPWEDQIFPEGTQLQPSAFHFAMTSPLREVEVLRRAREAQRYAEFMNPAGAARMFGPGLRQGNAASRAMA